MKAIINWIILIPVMILAVGVELFTALNPQGASNFFGMDTNGISEIIIIAIVVLFALFFVLSLFDRKTSPVHILRHNYAAGICSVIAAFALAGDTASKVAEGIRGMGLGAMDIILVAVSAVAAVALLLVGINHCTATNTKNTTSLLYLAIPLWCAVHLLSRFMSHTAQPVAMAETLDLVMYVLLAIFYMYAMMVVSLINGKNPVKATIYWGAPAAVAAVVYAISQVGVVLSSASPSIFDYLEPITCGAIGLYIISFIAELSFMSKTKEEQIVPQLSEESDESEEVEAVEADVPVVINDTTKESFDDTVEDEINQSMKKFYDDISSVESEIPEEKTEEPVLTTKKTTETPAKDYGSYFETEENVEMFLEDENVAVDTTKSRPVDKTKYPVTKEETAHHQAVRDDYVVGIDEVESTGSYSSVKEDVSDYVLTKSEEVPADKKGFDSYEARLDEIDRLIISIQGGDSEK